MTPDSKLKATPDFALSIERHFKRAVSHPVRSWCQAEILIIHPLSSPERVWAFIFIFLANRIPSSQFLSSIIPKLTNGPFYFVSRFFFCTCLYLMNYLTTFQHRALKALGPLSWIQRAISSSILWSSTLLKVDVEYLDLASKYFPSFTELQIYRVIC